MRTTTTNPDAELAELRAEAQNIADQYAQVNPEAAEIRERLAELPALISRAYDAAAITGDTTKADALDAERVELEDRQRILTLRIDGLSRSETIAERRIAEHYSEHIEHHAAVALAATERQREAFVRVQEAVAEAEAAWREAEALWAPVMRAGRNGHGIRIEPPRPAGSDPVTGHGFKPLPSRPFESASVVRALLPGAESMGAYLGNRRNIARPQNMQDGERIVTTGGE